jgi:Secretion system C-terminal sorting domain
MNGSNMGFIEGGENLNLDSVTLYEDGFSFISNTSIIIPMGNNKFYIFITTISDEKAYNYYKVSGDGYVYDEIRYSIVDMNSNNGKGKVIENRKLLFKATSEPWLNKTNFTATLHANGRDWWLIKPSARDRYKRYKFLVSEKEIIKYEEELPHITSNFVYDLVGQSCFSQDGSLYAECNSNCPTTIWNFDRCSGKFTLKRIIDIQKINKDVSTPFAKATGVCFSADNKYLYQAEFYSIYQIDLEEPNDTVAMHWYSQVDTSKNSSWNNSLQMTPEGQIFIGHWHGISADVNAIMRPNEYREASDLKFDYMQCKRIFWPNIVAGINDPPNMINYELGALAGSPCDTIKHAFSFFKEWIISPNPTQSFIEVQIPVQGAESLQIIIYNSLGQKVQESLYNIDYTYKIKHEFGAFSRGMYFTKCITNNGQSYSQKIIKL